MKSTFFDKNLKGNSLKEIISDGDSIKILEDSSEFEDESEEEDCETIDKSKTLLSKTTLKGDIQLLFKEADSFTNEENYQEALKKYNEIIKRLKDTTDIRLLEDFAGANFYKAYIYINYIHDNNKAIEAYNMVADRFRDSNNGILLKLYFNAQKNKIPLLDRDEAIYIYDEIIDKFKDSSDIELLKKFSLAQNAKAYLLEGNEKIEIYDEIIDKFKDSKNRELLKELINAEFSKASLVSNREALEVYDEIIDKFENHNDTLFEQQVADALFYKSYLLMSEDREESMEMLDKIIDKYKDKKDKGSSKNFEYAVINNIELSLVTNSDSSRYVDLANEYLLDIPDTKPQMEMLEILHNAQYAEQDEALAIWKKKYKDYQFENWSFDTLKDWNEKMEDKVEKARIKTYLNEFIKHNEGVN
jgi:hypothetical protein